MYDPAVVEREHVAGRAAPAQKMFPDPLKFIVSSRCAVTTDVDEPDLLRRALRRCVDLDEQESLRRAIAIYNIVTDATGRLCAIPQPMP
jgi:hypothetical protein